MDTEKNTKKVKKGKVIAVVIILIIIIAVVAVLIVKNVNKNKEEGNNTVQGEEELERTIELPDTTYSEMPVKDVNMELMEDINKTVVSFTIDNVTPNEVANEKFNAILLDSSETTVGEMETFIPTLPAGEQYSLSVVMDGDLTSATHIVLQKIN